MRKRPRTVDVSSADEVLNTVRQEDPISENLPNSLSNSEMANTTLENDNAGGPANANENRRGPTLMAHVWNQPKEKRILVQWNKFWQPIGGERSDLAHFLGTMARNPQLCPLSYTDWRLLPKPTKEDLLKIVKSKFIIPHPSAVKYVMSSMGKKWSNYKGDLRLQYYEPNSQNISSALSARPDTVPKDQWVSLVTHWSSLKGKQRSETNRKSRGRQVMAHTAGSKSFACVIAEKTLNGVAPSRAHVFLETHKDRITNPNPMDEKSIEAVVLINEKLSELPNSVELTDVNIAWPGDIYSQVMDDIIGPERRGRVRGLGRGIKSLASIAHNPCEDYMDDDHDACTEKIEDLACQLKKTKENNAKLKDKYAKLEDKYEKMEKENAEAQSRIMDELSLLKAALLGRRSFSESTT